MTQYAFDLPDSMLKAAAKAAEQDGTTVEQFVTVAMAENLSALQTEGLIEARASRADLHRYRAILAKVPNVPAAPGYDLPQA
jgi:hypothetical protein